MRGVSPLDSTIYKRPERAGNGNHNAHRSIKTLSQVDTLLGAARGKIPRTAGTGYTCRMDSHGTADNYSPLTLASDATGE